MDFHDNISPRLWELVHASCERTISEQEESELAALLESDPNALDFYIDILNLEADIAWLASAKSHNEMDPGYDGAMDARTASMPPRSPTLGFLANLTSGGMQFLNDHSPWSFVMLFLIFCTTVAATSYLVTHGSSEPMPVEIAAEITSTKECVWSKDAATPAGNKKLPVGQELHLAKGLVEITYDSGAVVLLEGPASFSADSVNSGILSSGRLTTRAETAQSHGFAISTPNARIIDLGTEFGVKTDAQNNAEVHVFRGTVELDNDAQQGSRKAAARLSRGMAARIDANSQVKYLPQADPNEFVLRMDAPRKKQLELLDIVSGGDGFNPNWQEGGINPKTGNRDNEEFSKELTGDGAYHSVNGLPLVNGIFIPTGKGTQLDSAGHAYDFPKTDNMMSRYVYVTRKVQDPDNALWGSAGSGIAYMPSGRGLLCMHANAGLTFDLEAMRKSHAGWTPVKFSAVAGNVFDSSQAPRVADFPINEKAEVWVFVDGQLRFHRGELSRADGPIPFDVLLAPKDRFLTLVTTDRIGNHNFTHMVFGDPVLYLEAGP